MTDAIVDSPEYQEFAAALTKHIASLANVTGRYTAKLVDEERDYFFETAIRLAWERRATFSQTRACMVFWWNEICRSVALSRPQWRVLTITGSRLVPGAELHLWGWGCHGELM